MLSGTLPLPSAAAARRGEALRAIAPHLSDRILDALVTSIVRHADDLTPGRLYTRTGGCAVGVMLRDLYPDTCGPGHQRWFLPRRSLTVRQETRARLGADTVRLEHIEDCFDSTCRAVTRHNPRMSRSEAATHVGLWMAAELADERAARRARDGQVPTTAASPRLSASSSPPVISRP